MRAREPLGERDADRAHGDMDRESLKPREYTVCAEYHAFDRSIVREHGDGHIAARSLPWRLGERRTFSDERLGLGRRAVIDGESVSVLEQIGGHATAHVAKPDEPNLHDLQLLRLRRARASFLLIASPGRAAKLRQMAGRVREIWGPESETFISWQT